MDWMIAFNFIVGSVLTLQSIQAFRQRRMGWVYVTAFFAAANFACVWARFSIERLV